MFYEYIILAIVWVIDRRWKRKWSVNGNPSEDTGFHGGSKKYGEEEVFTKKKNMQRN